MNGKNPIFRRMSAIGAAFAAVFVLTGSAPHHGWASYHQDIELTYVGIITSNDIGNPHTYIDLTVVEDESDVSEDDRARGYTEVGEWNVVLAPVTRMRARGMSDDAMLDVGDTVTVVGYPHRTVEQEMRAERIIINGLSIELR